MTENRERCHVYGNVKYGGYIESRNKTKSLVTLDEIDKDKNVTISIKNKQISTKKEV